MGGVLPPSLLEGASPAGTPIGTTPAPPAQGMPAGGSGVDPSQLLSSAGPGGLGSPEGGLGGGPGGGQDFGQMISSMYLMIDERMGTFAELFTGMGQTGPKIARARQIFQEAVQEGLGGLGLATGSDTAPVRTKTETAGKRFPGGGFGNPTPQ